MMLIYKNSKNQDNKLMCEKERTIIEMVQRRAAQFIKHEYSRDPGIVTSILQELELQALQERQKHHVCYSSTK